MAKKPQQETFVTYVIEFDASESDYSFGLKHDKHSTIPYSEYFHPQLSGKIIQPDIKSISRATITLLGDRHLEEIISERKKTNQEPGCIGSIESRSSELHGIIALPFNPVAMIMHGVASDQIKFVTIHAPKLKYRRALVRSIGFVKTFDPEMY